MNSRLPTSSRTWFAPEDPERDRFASTVCAARLLLLAVEEGQNVAMLARRLGCSQTFVARCARRLLENGVWKGGRTVAAWLNRGPDHPAFWYDVAVAEGTMCRRTRPSGEFEWAAAGAWLRASPSHSAPGQTGWVVRPGREPETASAGERLPKVALPAKHDGPAHWLRIMGYPRAREHDPIRALFPNAEWLGEA
jgi:hypothetical protein